MTNQLRILVVEDEVFFARCICEDLQDLGVTPLEPVPKGEMAVEVALREHPDLILMDIRLAGGMDGIEAARKIREESPIQIIFMSAFVTDYIKEKVRNVEYLAFFEKPVTIEQLEPVITAMKDQ